VEHQFADTLVGTRASPQISRSDLVHWPIAAEASLAASGGAAAIACWSFQGAVIDFMIAAGL